VALNSTYVYTGNIGRPAWRRPLILGIILTIVGVFAAILGVLDVPHTIAVIASIVGLNYLISQGTDRRAEPWPNPPVRFRGGARTEVARLAWKTVDRQGDVSENVLARVRQLAQITMAAHGLSWSGQPGDPITPRPLAEQLLGASDIQTLTTTGNKRRRALENAVSRLEMLRNNP